MKRTQLLLLSVLFGFILIGLSVWVVKKYILPGGLPGISVDIVAPKYSTERDIAYCRPGGEPQKLDLYSVVGGEGKKYPAIIYLHGGNWSEGDKASGEVLQYLPLLSRAGYTVASVNYRLLPEHKFPAAIEDAKCAVRFLRANSEKYNINSKNIGVIGDSAGGYLAAFLGVSGDDAQFKSAEHKNQSDKVQAVIDLFGPTDFTIGGGGSSKIATAKQFIGKVPPLDASPTTYVSKGDSPFLLIHGDMDKTVPLVQSTVMHQKLLTANISSELIVIKNAGHELPKEGQGLSPTPFEVATKILSFLNQNLRN